MKKAKDNSPVAIEWATRHEACEPAIRWLRTLGPKATCRKAWLLCPNSEWLYWIVGKLKSVAQYKKVDVWYERVYFNNDVAPIPSANLFRQKCAKLGCYGKENHNVQG